MLYNFCRYWEPWFQFNHVDSRAHTWRSHFSLLHACRFFTILRRRSPLPVKKEKRAEERVPLPFRSREHFFHCVDRGRHDGTRNEFITSDTAIVAWALEPNSSILIFAPSSTFVDTPRSPLQTPRSIEPRPPRDPFTMKYRGIYGATPYRDIRACVRSVKYEKDVR